LLSSAPLARISALKPTRAALVTALDPVVDVDIARETMSRRDPRRKRTVRSSSPPLAPPKKAARVAAAPAGDVKPASSRWTFACVCSANMNRSMSGHKLMAAHGFKVRSYGTGRAVRLPGQRGPHEFDFGTTYENMHDQLRSGADAAWLGEKGLLEMLQRNMGVKAAPERWQDLRDFNGLDVVVCFDQRVYETLTDDVQSRDPGDFKALHIVNIDTQDDAEHAEISATAALDFCKAVNAEKDLESGMPMLVEGFDAPAGLTLEYALHYV
jgi:RNA polymerase II subunit A C-terminal domain phosphatase SSU72